jgi:hypothetical protein
VRRCCATGASPRACSAASRPRPTARARRRHRAAGARRKRIINAFQSSWPAVPFAYPCFMVRRGAAASCRRRIFVVAFLAPVFPFLTSFRGLRPRCGCARPFFVFLAAL